MKSLNSKKKHEKGQGLVEYALILVLVGIVVIGALTVLGPQIGNVFSDISNSISGGDSGGGAAAAVVPPTVAPAPTLTYEQWCASLGGTYHLNSSGLCVKGSGG